MSDSHRDSDIRASILIVDDDPEIRALLSRFLVNEGYQIEVAPNAREADRVTAAKTFDLIILDIMMPGEDGFSFTRNFRAKSDIPIIILTGKGETVDRIVGLEIGADHYVSKPFDLRELLAHIRSAMRGYDQRTRKTRGAEPSIARFRGWQFDLAAHELVSSGGLNVHLTTYEFRLLLALVQSGKRVLTRDQILELIADRESYPYDRSVDVLVSKLRRKIEEDPSKPTLIKTIRGVGYMFTAPVEFT
jgi:DNA-binding response OmpR family regulator